MKNLEYYQLLTPSLLNFIATGRKGNLCKNQLEKLEAAKAA